MIPTAEFTCWVGKADNKGKYAILFASTSREDKKKNEKFYSNWIVRCVGESYNKVMEELFEKYVDGEKNSAGYLKKKIGIKVTRGQFTNEPYENKDGQKVYENNQLLAWEGRFLKEKESGDSPAPNKSDTKKKPSPFDGDEE